MKRREFLRRSLKSSAAAAAGSVLLSRPVRAAQNATASPNPDAMSKAALKHFLSDKRTCVEAMLLPGAEALDIENPLLADIGLGLASGIGRQGRTCGVILGAAMVAGLAVGRKEWGHAKKKAALAAVAKMFREFENRHGSTDCRTLTGLDLATTEGRAKHKAGGRQRICSRFVDTGARLMAEMLAGI